MTHAARDVAPDDGSIGGPSTSGASVTVRALPPRLVEQRDRLFGDADRHGPRFSALARRVLPGATLLPLVVWLATWSPWRALVQDVAPASLADAILLVPVLVALVVLAACTAPLARSATAPILAGGALLLALGAGVIHGGEFVAATVPAAYGAVLVGIAAARALRRAVWALPVLLAAGISDAHSVRGGITNDLLSGVTSDSAATERVQAVLRVPASAVAQVDYVVLHIPVATGTWVLGLVDVIALGLLLGLTHLFWQPLGRVGCALAVALVITIGAGSPVPVLPVLGIAWALANARLVWRSTRFSLRRLFYLGG